VDDASPGRSDDECRRWMVDDGDFFWRADWDDYTRSNLTRLFGLLVVLLVDLVRTVL